MDTSLLGPIYVAFDLCCFCWNHVWYWQFFFFFLLYLCQILCFQANTSNFHKKNTFFGLSLKLQTRQKSGVSKNVLYAWPIGFFDFFNCSVGKDVQIFVLSGFFHFFFNSELTLTILLSFLKLNSENLQSLTKNK